MQVDALVFERPPQPLDEDVVEEPALAIHRDAHADLAQPVRPGEGRELEPWSEFMISGTPNLWIASFNASTQKSASSVLEMRQARTLRVASP